MPISLSVIFCVNRDNPFLTAAIQSVLHQTHKDFEFLIGANSVVGEDGPPIALASRLQDICGNDSRVSIHQIAMPQLAFGLNYLASKATGDYLVRMDADDLCRPDRLALLAEGIEQTGADIVGSWATLIDESGAAIGAFEPPTAHDPIARRLVYATALYHPTVAIRRRFLLDLRGYSGGFSSEDYDLWVRALRAGGRFSNIPQHLLRYRLHSGQISGSRLQRAEIAGYRLRELCLAPSWRNLYGLLIALTKNATGHRLTGHLRRLLMGESSASSSNKS